MADWENVGKIQGEKGDKGERGAKGEDGINGKDGKDGKDGNEYTFINPPVPDFDDGLESYDDGLTIIGTTSGSSYGFPHNNLMILTFKSSDTMAVQIITRGATSLSERIYIRHSDQGEWSELEEFQKKE